MIAGEASGDMHGALLMQAMKNRRPHLRFLGIGGDRMIAEGLEPVRHSKEMAFLGFFEVIRHLGFIRRVFKDTLCAIETHRPAAVIFIDYPGFNLRLAKQVKKLGFRTLYYISPQVWAWGGDRVKKMRRFIDRMLVILPFETDIYRAHGMDVHFVGHPLKDHLKIRSSHNEFFRNGHMDPDAVLVGLLPGSRKQEIRTLLPEMSRACDVIRKHIPECQFALGMAPHLTSEDYTPYIRGSSAIRFIENDTYGLMAHAGAVMVASGTATLETALLGTPMVICYKVSWISYLLGRLLIRIKHIGLVNIVSGRSIVPELIQHRANAGEMGRAILSILTDRNVLARIKQDLNQISELLGEQGASDRAADLVVEFIDGSP